jgi:hypothetical protein
VSFAAKESCVGEKANTAVTTGRALYIPSSIDVETNTPGPLIHALHLAPHAPAVACQCHSQLCSIDS